MILIIKLASRVYIFKALSTFGQVSEFWKQSCKVLKNTVE